MDVGWQNDQNQRFSLDHMCSTYAISRLTSLRWPQLLCCLEFGLGCFYTRISQGIRMYDYVSHKSNKWHDYDHRIRQCSGHFCVFAWPQHISCNKLGGTIACMRAQSTPQIPRHLLQTKSALARHRNENPNTPEKSLLGVKFDKYAQFFLNYFVGEPRLPIVLAPPQTGIQQFW